VPPCPMGPAPQRSGRLCTSVQTRQTVTDRPTNIAFSDVIKNTSKFTIKLEKYKLRFRHLQNSGNSRREYPVIKMEIMGGPVLCKTDSYFLTVAERHRQWHFAQASSRCPIMKNYFLPLEPTRR